MSDGGGFWSFTRYRDSGIQKAARTAKAPKDHETNIQLAVGKAVFGYREQLAAAKQKQQSKDQKHQQMVHQLQTMCML